MGLGIYIHFPFCMSKCGYCDFASCGKDKWPDSFDGYVERMEKELEFYMDTRAGGYLEDLMVSRSHEVEKRKLGNYRRMDFVKLEKVSVETVYFGGGTPSLMEVHQVEKLMGQLRPYLKEGAEVTMECNPGTVDGDKLRALRNAGINRISIGLQAAQDMILKKLGRIHTFAEFERTVQWAKEAGFQNISADVMFGLPEQSTEDWARTIEMVTGMGLSHISAYGLKIEEETAFDRLVLEGRLVLPEVETERKMYHEACRLFEEKGYVQYEISNFAKDGLVSRHNLNYWLSGDYIGIGLNSHSKLGDVRFWNYSDMVEYEDALEYGKLPVEGFEILDLRERIFERIILSLRLNEGLELNGFTREFGEGLDNIFGQSVRKNVENGLLELVEGRLRFTKRGRDLSNQVYLDFMD